MELTNQEMDMSLEVLHNISSKVKGKLAYAVAKNIRLLTTELTEYYQYKNEAIQKYGVPSDDKGGYELRVDSEGFKQYVEEMLQYADITSNVAITKVDPEDVYGSDLNADDIVNISFMINE